MYYCFITVIAKVIDVWIDDCLEHNREDY